MIRRFIDSTLRGVTVFCLLLLLGSPARAVDAIPSEAYARVNDALLLNHVMPRYRLLARETRGLSDAVAEACAGSPADNIDVLRESYHATMDAWMGVQHLGFGPVELFMRSYRLYFWPQSRGKVGKAVDELLESPEALSGAELADASVAVQGLPAVEYLLYGRNTVRGGDSESASRRCTLLAVITRNMRDMAAAVVSDWRGGDVNHEASFLQPGPDNTYYSSHADATLALFRSFHDGLQLIADVKLKPVLGDSVDTARPALAESRRSERAMRNIVLNLEALEALYLGDGGPGLSELVVAHERDKALDPLMRKAFRLTLETARSIDTPLTSAVSDKTSRAQVEKLLTRVLALKQIVKSRVAPALSLTVGFNAMDGD